TVLKKEIGLRLEDELTQARTVLDRTMEDYRIWDKGKTKLGRTSLPSVSAPSMQAYTDLFFTTYVASLQTQEIDVRTTPRLEGTGSLYEFFAREKAGKR
ncbi:MAG: hypothetical protein WC096_00630, partial [Sphaerochaetaceae bacterium]